MGLTSKTAVDWHLKVKDIEFNVSLAKGYCISSIYKLIQKILGTHELNGHTPDFDHIHLKKSLKLLLAFRNLRQHVKNHLTPSKSFLRYSRF